MQTSKYPTSQIFARIGEQICSCYDNQIIARTFEKLRRCQGLPRDANTYGIADSAVESDVGGATGTPLAACLKIARLHAIYAMGYVTLQANRAKGTAIS